jgi:hypothetical protein
MYFLPKLPGGKNWMWDFSVNPFNPLGDNQNFGGMVTMTDDELAQAKADNQVANSEPFGFFDPSQWGQGPVRQG